MPKIVDHEKRKVKIAEATWKVIVEEGIEKATVRKIAQASGLSVGALRYYFSSQTKLLHFSMELVSERVTERIKGRKMSKGQDPLDFLKEGVCQVLPVDEERKIEMEVWLAFSAKVLIDKTFRDLSTKVYKDMHEGFRNVIYALQKFELAIDDLDPELEANRLHAIVDGMAMHHLLNPEQFSKEDIIKTLTYHLQSLCK